MSVDVAIGITIAMILFDRIKLRKKSFSACIVAGDFDYSAGAILSAWIMVGIDAVMP